MRVRRSCSGCILAATATLDQQGQEENNVRSQHNEENVAEPFATMMLDLDGSDSGSRNLKWIEFFHSFALPSQ